MQLSPLSLANSPRKMWRISSPWPTTMPPGHPNLSERCATLVEFTDFTASTLLSLQDYHSLMFGSSRSGTALASNVSHALCLPIGLQEVLDSNITDSSVEVCKLLSYIITFSFNCKEKFPFSLSLSLSLSLSQS